MRRARVAFSGAIHCAVPDGEGRLRLEDGRRVTEAEVVWLPPLEAGTILALGLNYADHAKELAFNAQEEPLVFLKGPGSLLGHRGCTRRPAQVKFMHYECELAVVIGRPAKNVSCAADVPDPAGLGLRTFVNGELRQQGNSRDLVHDIPHLIEYLSSFMTLAPNDVILTGTPEGVSNVQPGDEVACEIDGLGRLVNTLTADADFGR